jgi:hypothetical protein
MASWPLMPTKGKKLNESFEVEKKCRTKLHSLPLVFICLDGISRMSWLR